jgi:hypothetical protein
MSHPQVLSFSLIAPAKAAILFQFMTKPLQRTLIHYSLLRMGMGALSPKQSGRNVRLTAPASCAHVENERRHGSTPYVLVPLCFSKQPSFLEVRFLPSTPGLRDYPSLFMHVSAFL